MNRDGGQSQLMWNDRCYSWFPKKIEPSTRINRVGRFESALPGIENIARPGNFKPGTYAGLSAERFVKVLCMKTGRERCVSAEPAKYSNPRFPDTNQILLSSKNTVALHLIPL